MWMNDWGTPLGMTAQVLVDFVLVVILLIVFVIGRIWIDNQSDCPMPPSHDKQRTKPRRRRVEAWPVKLSCLTLVAIHSQPA
jgi:hypothetical protein